MQPDTSPFLDEIDTKYVQSVDGSLLYHARALDASLLPALNTTVLVLNKRSLLKK